MVLEKLGSSLKETLSKIAKAVFVDDTLIDELIKDIQRSLLQSDVNVKLVLDLSNKIKQRIKDEKIPQTITQKEHLINIVYEELVNFVGKDKVEISLDQKPFKIMFIGLYGSGKTSSIAKVAKYYSKRGFKVANLGLDVHRAAAMDQLEQVSKAINISCFINKTEKDPKKIYKEFEKELDKYDLVLIDTSGRDALSEDLITEIINITNLIKPQERLLVLSADIGQATQKQAEAFHKSCNITGVFLTKVDGTGKGGGAITACAATKAPIKFIGIGEKVDDIELFNPKGFISRLLGMGDLEALLEKAEEAISQEQAGDLGKKFLKGEFNFIDLYEQMEAMSKMGPLNKIMDLIPGMGNLNVPKEMLDVQEEKLKKWKFMLQSMSKKELEDPEVLSVSRIERIAKGSGTEVSEIRELLKQYRNSKKLMKMMKSQDPEKLMKKFKNKMKF
ncbi:MAG TPA: signal recognition particle receptor subunit alpha [Candidatus Nanoarchaeia archaeon]|nr:signal recognition particle receptor subunit alpha [Candidatus Nanoarchaeia archaeon]